MKASPELCKKSNSTGFSKLWRFRDLVHRSNSDGKERGLALCGLVPSDSTEREKLLTLGYPFKCVSFSFLCLTSVSVCSSCYRFSCDAWYRKKLLEHAYGKNYVILLRQKFILLFYHVTL